MRDPRCGVPSRPSSKSPLPGDQISALSASSAVQQSVLAAHAPGIFRLRCRKTTEALPVVLTARNYDLWLCTLSKSSRNRHRAVHRWLRALPTRTTASTTRTRDRLLSTDTVNPVPAPAEPHPLVPQGAVTRAAPPTGRSPEAGGPDRLPDDSERKHPDEPRIPAAGG